MNESKFSGLKYFTGILSATRFSKLRTLLVQLCFQARLKNKREKLFFVRLVSLLKKNFLHITCETKNKTSSSERIKNTKVVRYIWKSSCLKYPVFL